MAPTATDGSPGDEALLSFGSPRASFSLGDRRDAEAEPTATADLLAFYRQRCDEFQKERHAMLDRLAQIEVSKEETHRLKWELRGKTDEMAELEEALKKANAELFQAKADRIDLEAQNSMLRVREQEDRQKIQHLLALTQPITEEVTFVRDCRPGTRAVYPVQPRPPTPQTYSYPSTMHIASERMHPTRKGRSSSLTSTTRRETRHREHYFTAASTGSRTTRSSVNAKPISVVPGSKVLRTVYMPNEQTGGLTATVESLRQQLESHQQLSEAKAQHLVDEFGDEKAKLLQRLKQLEEKNELLEKQAAKAERILAQTTKDYLVLRHTSQESERLAQEELHRMEQHRDAVVREKEQVTQQVAHEREELQEIAREEGNQTVLEFRSQAQARDRDLHILKEQYAAVQEACTKRIQDLQTRLTKLRGRYRSLDRRRAMEMEGFTRDIANLKRHLQKLEVMHYGRRLTAQELQALRMDENCTLNSNELSEEIAGLQHRIAELSAEIADA